MHLPNDLAERPVGHRPFGMERRAAPGCGVLDQSQFAGFPRHFRPMIPRKSRRGAFGRCGIRSRPGRGRIQPSSRRAMTCA